MIGIINYGLGNLGSIVNMLNRVESNSIIINKPTELSKVSKIILPGVGAFDTGILNLMSQGWIEPLNRKVLFEKAPTLGICLGMQLITKSSEEGVLSGLGWIDGQARKFNFKGLKVPHMGWNVVSPTNGGGILRSNHQTEQRFYFVHSYYISVSNEKDVIGTTYYGDVFVSAFQHNNIIGVQFHPEKSHQFGIELMRNFSNM